MDGPPPNAGTMARSSTSGIPETALRVAEPGPPSTAHLDQTVCVIQEVMNERMQRLRGSATDLIQHGTLNEELEELVAKGLVVVDGCAYFSEALDANPHLSREKMGALGHQSLVNKLHLEDYWDSATRTEWDTWCVAQGSLLARRVLAEAERFTPLPIDVALTVDEGGALPPYSGYTTVSFGPDSGDESEPSSTFRFYVHRDGDCWIEDDDIHDKLDAVMILRRQAE